MSEPDSKAIREVLGALDPQKPAKVLQANGNGTETLASKPTSNYVTRLRLAASEVEDNPLNQTTDSIDQLMGDMATGHAEISANGGYAKGAVGQYRSALKAFYRYHVGHEFDPEEVPVFARDDTTIDDRDMLTVDEVQAMRKAIDSPRERCPFELLAYTGQRIRGI